MKVKLEAKANFIKFQAFVKRRFNCKACKLTGEENFIVCCLLLISLASTSDTLVLMCMNSMEEWKENRDMWWRQV